MLIGRVNMEHFLSCLENKWRLIVRLIETHNPFASSKRLYSIITKYMPMFDVPVYSLAAFERDFYGAVVRPLSAVPLYTEFNLIVLYARRMCSDFFVSSDVEVKELMKQVKTMLKQGFIILPDGSGVRVRTVRVSELRRGLIINGLRMVVPQAVDAAPSTMRAAIETLRSIGKIVVTTEGGRRWAFLRREVVPEFVEVARERARREAVRLVKRLAGTAPLSYRLRIAERGVKMLMDWLELPVNIETELVADTVNVVEDWLENPLKNHYKMKRFLQDISE